MPGAAPQIDVTDNPARSRYEIYFDGALAGFATYRARPDPHAPDRIVLLHTEVDDAFEGHGLGGRLIKAALDDIRGRGLRVVPLCPFARAYIDRHPEYEDMVVAN